MCKKKRYKDKIGAMFALSQCKFNMNFNFKRHEKRVYYCSECKAWHLTSKI